MEVRGKLTYVVIVWLIKIFDLASSVVGEKQLENSIWSGTVPVYSLRRTHIGPVPLVNRVMTEWSSWAVWQSCSRSCGGGIRSRKRKCITRYPRVMPGSGIRTTHDSCLGDIVQYEVCESQPCPRGSGVSFRAAQCRQHNSKKVLGRVVNNWVPYSKGGMNPCALVCEGEGEGLIYTFGKVTDGTHCTTNDRARKGMCVNGRCLRLSCDGKLGGKVEEDMCRVCGGRNDTCVRHRGVFHSDRPLADQPQNVPSNTIVQTTPKSFGYYEVVTIPKGSTNVRVTENSSNFLALRSGGKYLLNGNWLIDWPGDVDANGVTFSYTRKEDQSESLVSLGPTNGDLALMVLLREQNPGILYEYWSPQKNPISLLVVSSSEDEPRTQISTSLTLSTDPKSEAGELRSNLSLLLLQESSGDDRPAQVAEKDEDVKSSLPLELISLHLINDDKAPTYASANSVLSGVGGDQSEKTLKRKTKIKLPPWKAKKEKATNRKKKKKKKKKTKKRKKKKSGRKRSSRCRRRCSKRRRKIKQSFCTSDFVSRIEVLSVKEVSNWVRSEVLILQSYKNRVPLLHKEFLWQDSCHCKRLRRGKTYIVMGSTRDLRRRGNEVRLTLGLNSFVRRFTTNTQSRVMKIRRHEMRYCTKWRLKKHHGQFSQSHYSVNLIRKRHSQ